MSKDSVKKRHRKLLWKKIKYSVKSLFIKPKALFVDFLPLEKIGSNFCVKQIVIKPSSNIKTFLPREFSQEQKSVKTLSPDIKVFQLKNVMVTGDSSFFVSTHKNKLFYEKLHTDSRNFYLYEDRNLSFHSNSLAKIRNYEVKNHDYDAIYFGGIFTFNYYHFLIDILSKTQFLNSIPDAKSLTVVLDSTIKENENLKTLAVFFLKDYKIKFLEKECYHVFKNLWCINTPNPTIPNVMEGTKYEAYFTRISPESVDYLRSICMANYDEKQVNIQVVSKVFIARKSTFRKYNETELLDVSKKYGFEPVYFEDLNLHEQIFIMQNAGYIVGSSGAAWTNLLFTQPESKGLIWLGTVWGDFSVFSTLANIVNFDLYHVRYQSESTDFHENYILDPALFEKNLKQLLQL